MQDFQLNQDFRHIVICCGIYIFSLRTDAIACLNGSWNPRFAASLSLATRRAAVKSCGSLSIFNLHLAKGIIFRVKRHFQSLWQDGCVLLARFPRLLPVSPWLLHRCANGFLCPADCVNTHTFQLPSHTISPKHRLMLPFSIWRCSSSEVEPVCVAIISCLGCRCLAVLVA